MKLQRKLAIAFTALFSAALFFAIGYSALDGFSKGILMLSALVLSGMLLQRLTGFDGGYGTLILRGKNGLKFMQKLADRDPKFWREFCDFGLTLGFGLPYGWLLFSKTPKKFAKHAITIALIAGVFLLLPAALQIPSGDETKITNAAMPGLWATALLLAGGLCLAGFAALLSNTINILTVPNTPAGVMLVIPGLTVPWHWIVALIIAAAVHEIAHGILARVEKLEVKASGGILLGFLPIGAFVEPDEEKFKKLAIMKKQRILVAGTATNFATALIFALLLAASAPILPALAGGVAVASISATSPAAAMISPGDYVASINGKEIPNAAQFNKIMLSQNGLENISIKTTKMQKEDSFAATEIVVAAVANTTKTARSCDGLSKLNPFNGCFFAYSISCGAAKIACPPPLPVVPASGVLEAGDILLAIDGKPVFTVEQMRTALSAKTQGQEITLRTDRGEKKLALGAGGKLGIQARERPALAFEEKPKAGLENAYYAVSLLLAILSSTMQLNLALAVINLLPLFITDGSRIIYEELMFRLKEPYAEKGKKTLSSRIAVVAGMATVALLLINLIVPNL
ncbi:MAG: site-2 protease family protein [Candidatus Micrarchaeia archaeon]|jgi:membrane-associated protease RseP (regulator of RpoE activity)